MESSAQGRGARPRGMLFGQGGRRTTARVERARRQPEGKSPVTCGHREGSGGLVIMTSGWERKRELDAEEIPRLAGLLAGDEEATAACWGWSSAKEKAATACV